MCGCVGVGLAGRGFTGACCWGPSLGAFRVCGACRGRGLSLGYRCSSRAP
ncbi:hypothetical protein L3Y25_gp099 [Gordonia phage Syleon]|uniref:Uncharacterized protein n=1 Tax=Gordonia phage Syleon TaxID=2653718 RepID=A0A5Q2WH79_9CAUD|nr:hypothetical protein L3Y25_gp099 [Gordonia phage Syleon]QGH75865.1 hypothetical protein SEA_SYLEON_142 [Gordonia phage Syleon]